MTDVLAQPDPRDKRLHSPDRHVRMREKLRRMPAGTFTFAGHLEGIAKREAHEQLVDAYMRIEPAPEFFVMKDEDDALLVAFRKARGV